jgi:hypothetical protein
MKWCSPIGRPDELGIIPQRYEVMVHGLGLEEESPSVAYPSDPQPNEFR